MTAEPTPAPSGARPPISEILTPEAIRGVATGAGMTDLEAAQLYAPAGQDASHQFYGGILLGKAIVWLFRIRCRRTAELSLACSYPAAVRSLFHVLTVLRYGPIKAEDAPGGCRLQSVLPADHQSFKGRLDFELTDCGRRVRIKGTSTIFQMIDYGKGLKTLRNVFARVEEVASRIEPAA